MSRNIDRWREELRGDVDRDFLLRGLTEGFRVVDEGFTPEPVEVDNYKSALDRRDSVENQILEELSEGRYVFVKEKPVIVSALGALDKSDNRVRLIHDCSRPFARSVNDYVNRKEKMVYQSVADACSLVNQGYFMAKIDLRSAYRSVPIHPSNLRFSGIKWQFQGESDPRYMVDTRLMFGSKLAPNIFHRLSQAVRRIFYRHYGVQLVAYLDDFLVVGRTYEECNRHVLDLINLLRRLGFDIAWEKVVSPTQNLTFLGLQLDSISMQISLPESKLASLLDLIEQFLGAKRASKRELERLAGKLSYAAQVVLGGRTYLRRLFTVINSLKLPRHKILLPREFYEDLKWWEACLRVFNGKDIIPRPRDLSVMYMDACNDGCGFTWGSDWGYVNWKVDFRVAQDLHINNKEILALLFAVRRWGPSWRGLRVLVGTDNSTAKSVINKLSSSNPVVLRAMQEIFWCSIKFDFLLEAFHVPGVHNELADAVSRVHDLGEAIRLRSLLEMNCYPQNLLLSHMSPASLLYISHRWQDRLIKLNYL